MPYMSVQCTLCDAVAELHWVGELQWGHLHRLYTREYFGVHLYPAWHVDHISLWSAWVEPSSAVVTKILWFFFESTPLDWDHVCVIATTTKTRLMAITRTNESYSFSERIVTSQAQIVSQRIIQKESVRVYDWKNK